MNIFGIEITLASNGTPDPAVNVETVVDDIMLLTGNSSSQSRSSLMARLTSSVTGGYDFGDTLHDIYSDFGYPAHTQFFNHWNMYRRFGIAKTLVEKKPSICWETHPTIESASTKLVSDVESIVERLKLWHRFHGLDNRQRVGQYAGFFMRVKDGQTPDKPLETQFASPLTLVDILPLYESELIVLTTNQEQDSPDFGQPSMYQFTSAAVGNRDPKSAQAFNIHPSRIVIMAEGADNGGIYGISVLEAPYNSLMDLRKVSGAGGEGFYKNAAQSLVFQTNADSARKINPTLIKDLNEQYDDFVRNRSRRGFMAAGLDVHALQSDLINPKEFFDNPLYDVAASDQMPVTILIGQLTGKLASDEDSKQFRSNCQSRRVNFLTESIKSCIDWFQLYGIVDKGEYTVVWDDLLAASDEQKFKNAESMSSVNEKQFRSGGDGVFTSEEIRVAAGFEIKIDGDADELDNSDESVVEDDDDFDDDGDADVG